MNQIIQRLSVYSSIRSSSHQNINRVLFGYCFGIIRVSCSCDGWHGGIWILFLNYYRFGLLSALLISLEKVFSCSIKFIHLEVALTFSMCHLLYVKVFLKSTRTKPLGFSFFFLLVCPLCLNYDINDLLAVQLAFVPDSPVLSG